MVWRSYVGVLAAAVGFPRQVGAVLVDDVRTSFADDSQVSFLSSVFVTVGSSVPAMNILQGIWASMTLEVWGCSFVGGGGVTFNLYSSTAIALIANNTFYNNAGLSIGGNNVQSRSASSTRLASCNRGLPALVDAVLGPQVPCAFGSDAPIANLQSLGNASGGAAALRCARRLSFFAADTPRYVSTLPGPQPLAAKYFDRSPSADPFSHGNGRVILPCFAPARDVTASLTIGATQTYYERPLPPTASDSATASRTHIPAPSTSISEALTVTVSRPHAASASAGGPPPTPSAQSVPSATLRRHNDDEASKTPKAPRYHTQTITAYRRGGESDGGHEGGGGRTATPTRGRGAPHPPRTRTFVVYAPIPPPPTVVIGAAAQGAISAVGVVAAVSSVASVNGGQLGVANAVLRLAGCAEAEGDDSGLEEAASDIPVLVHPLRFGIGGDGVGEVEAAYAAAALSNAIFIPAVIGLAAVGPVAFVLSRVRRVPREEAVTTIGWPALLVLPFSTLGEGIGVSIVRSIAYSKATSSAAAGALALVAVACAAVGRRVGLADSKRNVTFSTHASVRGPAPQRWWRQCRRGG